MRCGCFAYGQGALILRRKTSFEDSLVGMNTPFLLLKLPFIAHQNAIRMLEIIEIIDLSLLSKNSRKAVKNSLLKNQLKILTKFRINYDFVIQMKDCDLRNHKCEFVTIENSHLNAQKKFLKIETEEDKDEEEEEDDEDSTLMGAFWTKRWSEYLCEILNQDIDTVVIDVKHYKGRLSEISKWLNFHQESINKVELRGHFIDSNEYSLFIDSCRINESLLLYPDEYSEMTSMNYKFNVHSLYAVQDQRVLEWITIDDIISFDCEQITLSDTPFDEPDLNRFLKSWINGSNERLKLITFFICEWSPELVFDGIEMEIRDDSIERRYDNFKMRDQKINGGMDIRRKHGTVATILCHPDPNRVPPITVVSTPILTVQAATPVPTRGNPEYDQLQRRLQNPQVDGDSVPSMEDPDLNSELWAPERRPDGVKEEDSPTKVEENEVSTVETPEIPPAEGVSS
uniref:F-box domain-containing protein n=1 Tax=Caenorhabditis tropicalis TaxID=1561998 RepID=A0A1I7UF95_9PELO